MIKPIRTVYKNCLFRSRLEARWAVFFDTLKIEWRYEPEGFVLPDNRCYLPDFYLPDVRLRDMAKGVWIEVKPLLSSDYSLAEAFGMGDSEGNGGNSTVLLVGSPSPRGHIQLGPWWDEEVWLACCAHCKAYSFQYSDQCYNDCVCKDCSKGKIATVFKNGTEIVPFRIATHLANTTHFGVRR